MCRQPPAIWPHAVEASRSTGIPPQFLVAQSALESGWGRNELRHADGSSSHNLFGIKAGKNWSGATVEAATTEYVNGQPQQVVERFRAYASYEESFRDYAVLLRDSSRYSSVIGSQDGTEFARRLQQAGYATDPMYADKLARIINGPTLRQALIG
ncbi:MAG: flagellar assembly peptidoglycan hydrolase FlgJ [Betaproteobacteria bacterium HGW-Betaproteobacteria-12]|nr:MAG: flagellar assembly peptidoglycan hydrolase FlgJ [Betaproteobacteria bacterium HGW-Betaproteobacteria-12]